MKWAAALLFAVALAAVSAAAAERLRVGVIAGLEAPPAAQTSAVRSLQTFLEGEFPIDCTVATVQPGGRARNLDALRAADALVLLLPGVKLAEEDTAFVREWLEAGRGAIILQSRGAALPAWKNFEAEILGATYAGPFAQAARLEVISAYAHPIFTGVPAFQFESAADAYKNVADDLQVMMEGTVGETSTPLAWARVHRGGRVFCFAPAGADLLERPDYRRIMGQSLLWVKHRPIAGAETAVQRSYVRDGHPGSFVITFPQGPGVCYDPVRGGINYAWDGDFADLRPRWMTKQGQPVRFWGDEFYRETAAAPVRTETGREPVYKFLGYAMADGVPEFRYRVDGVVVREQLQPTPDGTGFVRRFRLESGSGGLWCRCEAQGGAEITVTGARREGEWVHFAPGAGGEFAITVRMRKKATP